MSETVHGFDIPKRELTEEEASRKVTLDRFDEFHYDAGEDFVDTFGHINHLILGGFLMALHPRLADNIILICDDKYGEALSFMHMYREELDDVHDDKFYTDLSKFINLNTKLKKEVNQILIQVTEYYNK